MATWFTTTTEPTHVRTYSSEAAMHEEQAAATAHGWSVLSLSLCDETTLPPGHLGQRPVRADQPPASISVAYLRQQAA